MRFGRSLWSANQVAKRNGFKSVAPCPSTLEKQYIFIRIFEFQQFPPRKPLTFLIFSNLSDASFAQFSRANPEERRRAGKRDAHPLSLPELQHPRGELRRVGVARASISALRACGQTGRNRARSADTATRQHARSVCQPPRHSATKTKRSKITGGSREGGGRALFAARLDATLRGRPPLFRAATQPPEPPSIPKYPG